MVMREKTAFSGFGQAERSYFGEAQMIFSHAKVAKPTSNTNLIRNKAWQVCRETNIYQIYCDIKTFAHFSSVYVTFRKGN